MSPDLLLTVAAFVCFLLATFGVTVSNRPAPPEPGQPPPRSWSINLVALGLALLTLTRLL